MAEMTTQTGAVLERLDDPEGLEALYRQDPQAFRDSLEQAYRAAPDSIALRIWRARLEYREPAQGAEHRRSMWYAIGIGLAVGALVRLPALAFGEDWYYPRFAPLWITLATAAYFLIRRPDRTLLLIGMGSTLAVVAYVSLLPAEYSDSIVMALIHLPLVIWTYVAMAFLGDSWRHAPSRIRFVRYCGELVVLASLVTLGGIVFSGVTIAMFAMIGDDVEEWYFSNVVIFAAAALPVAGTYLYDAVFNRRTAIAGVLARVFAPLFLLMVITYLVVTVVEGENPFVDRSFLITFNGLLLLVLGISVFSLVERGEGSDVGLIDYVNLALVGVTLLMDAVALSAILFRLASYGFTPNRVTVLGANLIVLVHLLWIGATYVALVRRKVGFSAMERVVGDYLPVYVVWAAMVAFLLPVVFAFA